VNEKYIIIGRSSCPFCTMAQDIALAYGREFTFLDFNVKRDILEDYKNFYKQKTVPIILSNHLETGLVKKIGGYSDLLEHLHGRK
jgi:glutaredoxin